MVYTILMFVYIVNNPLAYLARTIFITPVHLYFGSAHISRQGGVYGLPDKGALVIKAEVL